MEVVLAEVVSRVDAQPRGLRPGRHRGERHERRLHIAPGTHWSEHREKTFANLSILAESDTVTFNLVL